MRRGDRSGVMSDGVVTCVGMHGGGNQGGRGD